MNIVFELVRYIIIVIIGIILIKWYERKKGWEHQFRTSLLFILCWKTIMLFILTGMNLILDLFLLDVFLNVNDLFIVYPLMLVLLSFFINILLGISFFKLVYNQKNQESIVIILIIVIIEMILESILLYSTLISEFLIT